MRRVRINPKFFVVLVVSASAFGEPTPKPDLPEPEYVQRYRAEADRQRQAKIVELEVTLADIEKKYAEQKEYYDYLKPGIKKRRLENTVEGLKSRVDFLRSEIDKLKKNDPPFEPLLLDLKLGNLAIGDIGPFPAWGVIEPGPMVMVDGKIPFQIGTTYTPRIIQIIDASNMLLGLEAYRQSRHDQPFRHLSTQMVWLSGMPTGEHIDNEAIKPKGVFCVAGTRQYAAVSGGSQTVLVLQWLNPSILKTKPPASQPVAEP